VQGVLSGFDICIDSAIELGPTDTQLLQNLPPILLPAEDFPTEESQRRSHRLLNYTKLRVPGTSNEPKRLSLAYQFHPCSGTGRREMFEFDMLDEAVENLLPGGLRGEW
jgi:hypothetical protein